MANREIRSLQWGSTFMFAAGILFFAFFQLAKTSPFHGVNPFDLSIHFLAPVREGLLRARAKVIRRGRRAAYVECDVETEEGSLVARAQSTLLFARPEG